MKKELIEMLNITDKLDNQCLIAIIVIVVLMVIAIRYAFKHSEKIAEIYREVKK